MNNPSDAFLLAAVSSSMISDVSTTNVNNMMNISNDNDDNNDDDSNSTSNNNNSGDDNNDDDRSRNRNNDDNNSVDASYRNYMSTMKFNLAEYSMFQSSRTGDALITALLNNPMDHIIISNADDDVKDDDHDDDENDDISGDNNSYNNNDSRDDDNDYIYSITKNIDRSTLNTILSRIIHNTNTNHKNNNYNHNNNHHHISSIYAILELITPQYSFHPTLTCSSKGYCSLFTFIQREIRKVADRKSSFLIKQTKYNENNNSYNKDDDYRDDNDNEEDSKIMSDKEQLKQLYNIRDNVWKHLKTSIKTNYNNKKDNDNNSNSNSGGNIKSYDVLNGRVIDAFLRCYQFDMNGAKMIWSKEILPLLKALYQQPIDGIDNYNSR